MMEVHELLATNPVIPVHKYGLLDGNVNVFKVGRNEKDQVCFSTTFCMTRGSGGAVETSIFIQPGIESVSTHGTVCTLSAAIVPGPLIHPLICS